MGIESDHDLPIRTRKRVTRRLIPFLMFIYLLAYLDRANLSVAKLQMQADLGFSDAMIGFGAGVFFLGYLLMNIPASLLAERWSARKLIAQIMISFGAVAVLTGFLGSPIFGSVRLSTQFYIFGLLLGITEAGLFPGVIVYLSHWYRPEDRARAKGYFMIAQPIAIALGIPDFRLDSGEYPLGRSRRLAMGLHSRRTSSVSDHLCHFLVSAGSATKGRMACR